MVTRIRAGQTRSSYLVAVNTSTFSSPKCPYGANTASHSVRIGSFSPTQIWPESETELSLYPASTLRISGVVHQIPICLNFFYENNLAFFMYYGHK